jgi:hypothetical protein
MRLIKLIKIGTNLLTRQRRLPASLFFFFERPKMFVQRILPYTLLFMSMTIVSPCLYAMDKETSKSNQTIEQAPDYFFVFKNKMENQPFVLIFIDYDDKEKLFTFNPHEILTFTPQDLFSINLIEFVTVDRAIDITQSEDQEYLKSISPTKRYCFSISKDLEIFHNANQTLYTTINLGTYKKFNTNFSINYLEISISYFNNEIICLGIKRLFANTESSSSDQNNQEDKKDKSVNDKN